MKTLLLHLASQSARPPRVGFALAALLVSAASVVSAAEWPHWRGPFFNGTTDETNLPVEWSLTEGIAWRVELPGASAGTPVVFSDRLYLSSTDTAEESLLAMCFERTTGKPLWRHQMGKGVRRDKGSTFAAASAVTDGRVAVFFYGTGVLAAFSPEGKRLWARNLAEEYGEFAFGWTFASSPTLHDGKLFIQVLQRDVPAGGRGLKDRVNESYILALEPATGKTLWRHVRPSRAKAESLEAFTTPIPARLAGRWQLLVAGGDAISGHDLATGREIWRWGTWNPERIGHWRLVPSPVAGAGVVLVCAPKKDPVYAIRPKGTGMLGDDAVAWVSREHTAVTSDVPSPAFYDGDFFVLSDLKRSLSRVDPSNWTVKWTVPTPSMTKYEASPLVADGKVYLMNHQAEVAVLDVRDGRVLKEIAMDQPARGEMARASIVASHGHLFIRTARTLYCVGE